MKAVLKRMLRKLGYGLRDLQATANGDPIFAIRRLLRNHELVILDVGANRGEMTAEFLEAFPKASIHAFEPFPPCAEELRSRFKGRSAVHVYDLAVSNVNGHARMNTFAGTELNSLLTLDPKGVHLGEQPAEGSGVVDVQCCTLDQFAMRHGITRIDLAKIDVQGNELAVFEGASVLLAAGAVTAIYCEVMFAPEYLGQPYFKDIDAALARFGYTIFGLYDLSAGGDGAITYGNALYVSPEMKSRCQKDLHYWKTLA